MLSRDVTSSVACYEMRRSLLCSSFSVREAEFVDFYVTFAHMQSTN